MLIGISGYIGSGKDTLANMIQYQIHLRRLMKFGTLGPDFISKSSDLNSGYWSQWNEHSPYVRAAKSLGIKKFATSLKQIVGTLLNVNPADLEKIEFKNSLVDPIWFRDGKPRTYREVMQVVGTELFREHFHENTWVNALMGGYKGSYIGENTEMTYPDWIVTDVRFPNEAAAIKEAGGLLIRIGGLTTTSTHESEIGLDDYDDFDYHLFNHHKYSEGKVSPEESLQRLMYETVSFVNYFKLIDYAGTNRRPEPTKPGATKDPQ